MKLDVGIISALLVLCLDGAIAAPRGTSTPEGALRRRLQMQDMNNNMNNGKPAGGGGGGGGGNNQGVADENRPLIVENHPCDPDAERARNYVATFGHGDQGDTDCFADPVNGCPGGCCRYAQWFVCDTDNLAPSMQCVCNDLTAPLPEPPVVTAPPVIPEVPAGNMTMPQTNATTVNVTSLDHLDNFPEVLAEKAEPIHADKEIFD